MSEQVHITPIGGCGEFGKNLTLYLYKDSVYVVDCGIKFAEVWQAGFMGLLADYRQVFARYGNPTAYLLTHGHEDHIGALPLFYNSFPAPIYTTAWTMELIKIKFSKYNFTFKTDLHIVSPYDKFEFADGFTVDWLPMNHSIPMTCSLLIRAGGYKIFHTGDFKFDPTPPYEPKTDFSYIKKLSPVDLLLVDSTNSGTAGASPSEQSVREPLRTYMQKDYRRIFITTFASNLWRVMQLIELAHSLGKGIYVLGRAIEMSLAIASQLRMFDLEKYAIKYVSGKTKYIPENTVILVSGCQGERFGGLTKIAQGRFPACEAGEGDLVIFSSRPIPGNELSIIKLCERFKEKGAEVATVRENPKVHVSGHAYSADIAKLIDCLSPKMIIPVHGNFSHLDGVQKICEGTYSQIPINGDLFRLDDDGLTLLDSEQFGELYVDAESLVPMSFKTMKNRLRLGELGLCQVAGAIDRKTRKWLQTPFINELVGVVEEDECEVLCKQIRKRLGAELANKNLLTLPINKLNDEIRLLFRRQINNYLGKKVHVSSTILEV